MHTVKYNILNLVSKTYLYQIVEHDLVDCSLVFLFVTVALVVDGILAAYLGQTGQNDHTAVAHYNYIAGNCLAHWDRVAGQLHHGG